MKRLAQEPVSKVEPFSKEEYASRRNVGMRGQGHRPHKLAGAHATVGNKPVSAKALRKNTKRARKAPAI